VKSWCCLCLVALLPGCMAANSRPPAEKVYGHEVIRGSRYTPSQFGGVIFVANGSGDSETLSQSLSLAIGRASLPLEVKTFGWSHGQGRVLADHLDRENQIEQSRRLAALIASHRQNHPDRLVYLAAHSSGSAVALGAAEVLPPDTLENIVLISAAVPESYPLAPALRSSRSGIDVFYSEQDVLVLGLGMTIFGATDGESRRAAGRIGFRPIARTPAEASLYQKLRQHAWDPAEAWTGHDGSHYGALKTEYLRAYVVPAMIKQSSQTQIQPTP
jgi:pimeloyl-ACP methyl ester carboxylesterase